MTEVKPCAKCRQIPSVREGSSGWEFECKCHIWILGKNRPEAEAIDEYNWLQEMILEQQKRSE